MSLFFAGSMYLVIWWIVLFAILPIGVRTSEEEGEKVVPGAAESAPHATNLLPKMVATTVVFEHRVRRALHGHRAPRDRARRHPVPPTLRARAVAGESAGRQTKKARPDRPCFSNVTPCLPCLGEARPSISNVEDAGKRAAAPMLQHDQRAWSYFLPRLGPGPISTLEPEIVYRSRTLRRCGMHPR